MVTWNPGVSMSTVAGFLSSTEWLCFEILRLVSDPEPLPNILWWANFDVYPPLKTNFRFMFNSCQPVNHVFWRMDFFPGVKFCQGAKSNAMKPGFLRRGWECSCETVGLQMGVKRVCIILKYQLLLMAEILHQLIDSLSHYLQGSIHPRWCRISAINSMKY